MATKTIAADPFDLAFDPATTALLMIDMQRDFVEPRASASCWAMTCPWFAPQSNPSIGSRGRPRIRDVRASHPEGHRPDLTDCPPAKVEPRRAQHAHRRPRARWAASCPRREGARHHHELYPRAGEPVVDKPGKGAFYATDLHLILHTADRDADRLRRDHRGLRPHHRARGERSRLRCLVPGDCCASYFPEFHEVGAAHDQGAGRHLGWVSNSKNAIAAIGS